MIFGVSALVGAFGGACSDNAEPDTTQLGQQIAVETEETGTVVSEMAAVRVAENFFTGQGGEGLATRSASGALKSPASVKSVKADAGEPAMHVINYSGGGFAIVSATRDYHPVLAYSDEGSFELTDDMGPVDVWLSETKESIRVAESLDADTKASIRAQWNRLESASAALSVTPNASAPKTRASDPLMVQAFHNRVSQIMNQYPGQYAPLTLNQAASYLDYSYIREISDLAEAYGSPPEYTIVGVKQEIITLNNVGPLLTTSWHQYPPFNDYCYNATSSENTLAGCTAIALAQIMRFHRDAGNSSYSWYAMPDSVPGSGSGLPSPVPHGYYDVLSDFIRDVGVRIGLNYANGDSEAYMDEVTNAITSYGYTYNVYAHNATTVKNWITTERKPIAMEGEIINGVGHLWVCDGVQERHYQTSFFVEFINSYYNYSDYGHWSIYSPEVVWPSPYSTYFHMNWGWDQNNGWFLGNDVRVSKDGVQYDLRYNRLNYYLKP